jgi:hypothetical protein
MLDSRNSPQAGASMNNRLRMLVHCNKIRVAACNRR